MFLIECIRIFHAKLYNYTDWLFYVTSADILRLANNKRNKLTYNDQSNGRICHSHGTARCTRIHSTVFDLEILNPYFVFFVNDPFLDERVEGEFVRLCEAHGWLGNTFGRTRDVHVLSTPRFELRAEVWGQGWSN